jgi:hypothetical protein
VQTPSPSQPGHENETTLIDFGVASADNGATQMEEGEMFRTAVVTSFAGVLFFAPDPALAADANAETTNAAMHAGLAAKAADLAGVHTHLHHAVNCLVGPAGPGYDGKEMNPCANSGSGAIPDSTNPSTKQALEAALAKANSGIAATDLATAQKDAAATEAMLKSAK